MGSSDRERWVPHILDAIGAGYHLVPLDVTGAPSGTIDFVSDDGTVFVEVTVLTNSQEEESRSQRRRHRVDGLPGTWFLQRTGSPRWKDVRSRLPVLLQQVLGAGLDKFDQDTPGATVEAIRRLGFASGRQIATDCSGYVDLCVGPMTGYNVVDLLDAIDCAIESNRNKLEAYGATELFMFVDPSCSHVWAAFCSLETYVEGFSPPGGIELLPSMRCVWLCATNVTETGVVFDLWRVDGDGEGNWRRFQGSIVPPIS